MTLNKIYEMISNSTESNYSIFFLRRSKSDEGISYSVIKTQRSRKLGITLKNDALDVTNRLMSREMVSYLDVLSQERNKIQFITHNEVPNFRNILQACTSRGAQNIKKPEDLAKNLWGYVIKINYDNCQIYLFFKYRPAELVNVKKSFFSINKSSIIEPVSNKNVFSLDREYDAIIMMSQSNPALTTDIFIVNRYEFEEFFSFKEYYSNYIHNNKSVLQESNILDNVDDFINRCAKNFQYSMRLARIIRNGRLSSIPIDRIPGLIEQRHLSVQVEHGKIQYNKRYAEEILDILDDNYLESSLTQTKYKATGGKIETP